MAGFMQVKTLLTGINQKCIQKFFVYIDILTAFQ